jgi:hypothetical protein
LEQGRWERERRAAAAAVGRDNVLTEAGAESLLTQVHMGSLTKIYNTDMFICENI